MKKAVTLKPLTTAVKKNLPSKSPFPRKNSIASTPKSYKKNRSRRLKKKNGKTKDIQIHKILIQFTHRKVGEVAPVLVRKIPIIRSGSFMISVILSKLMEIDSIA